MKVTEIFHNIECDCCKALVDEMHWSDPETIKMTYDEEGWKNLGGRDYCPDCWNWDDDDNITTKDGRKFNEEGEELLDWSKLSEENKATFFKEEPFKIMK